MINIIKVNFKGEESRWVLEIDSSKTLIHKEQAEELMETGTWEEEIIEEYGIKRIIYTKED